MQTSGQFVALQNALLFSFNRSLSEILNSTSKNLKRLTINHHDMNLIQSTSAIWHKSLNSLSIACTWPHQGHGWHTILQMRTRLKNLTLLCPSQYPANLPNLPVPLIPALPKKLYLDIAFQMYLWGLSSGCPITHLTLRGIGTTVLDGIRESSARNVDLPNLTMSTVKVFTPVSSRVSVSRHQNSSA